MAGRRRRNNSSHSEEGGLERWLLTYADMITLLLALFIVLFAMSTIDVVRFDALKRTLAQSFNGEVLTEQGRVLDGSEGALDPVAPGQTDANSAFQMQADSAMSAARAQQEKSFANEEKRLRAEVARLARDNKSLDGKLEVTTSERGIVIRLAGDTFFDSGSAELREELKASLVPLARDIKRERRSVRVEGHTDGAPISTARFPDNLELSTARANSVYRFLVGEGIRPVASTGYADTVPVKRPPAGNPHLSIAENRRVEIVILAPGANVGGAEAKQTYGSKPKIGQSDNGPKSPVPDPTGGSDDTFNIIGSVIA
jgi:chemotaxis protein MotB